MYLIRLLFSAFLFALSWKMKNDLDLRVEILLNQYFINTSKASYCWKLTLQDTLQILEPKTHYESSNTSLSLRQQSSPRVLNSTQQTSNTILALAWIMNPLVTFMAVWLRFKIVNKRENETSVLNVLGGHASKLFGATSL